MSVFDFMQDMLLGNMTDDFHLNCCDNTFTDEMIVKSVERASDFFNMDIPMTIVEDWTIGVYANNIYSEKDDVLIFNYEQLVDMGITEQDGLDLIMTHECAHRALQGMNQLGFDSHQEELCCDFMAGVRAGLNGIDVYQMENSLADTPISDTHPCGADRVTSIEAGVAFAKEYYELHGVAPTFSECLEYFRENNELADAANNQINLRPECSEPVLSAYETVSCVEITDDDVNGLKSYTQSEINSHISKAEHDMDYWKAQVRRHEELAEHEMWRESEISHMKSAERKYEAAKAEYNKWRNMKPEK